MIGSGPARRRGARLGRTTDNGHFGATRRVLPALAVVAAVALAAAGLLVALSRDGTPQTLDERVQAIGSKLGCVTCQNLSVADSPADTARAMRGEIRRRLRHGETPDQIESFFVDKYGQSILLSPRSVAPWVIPGLALAGGIGVLAWILWRRRAAPAQASAQIRLTSGERARIRREVDALEEPD
jgi:cytochrome c-type biogenesis protein CcmH